MKKTRLLTMLFAAATGLCVPFAISIGHSSAARSSSRPTTSDSPSGPLTDDLQLSYRLDHYTELAERGPLRGENIYAHKCWVCHNKYQVEAPHLEGLFHFDALITGAPVNDDTVTTQIRNGGPGMPSFHTTLSDADIADVVSYLHSDTCCVEGETLPANPWYRAVSHQWSVQSGLSAGAMGLVRIASGDPPVGIMVQLIAPNGVRTTVYTDEDGNYEFPRMQSGSYTLRIASPLEFKPYMREPVRIDGATKLDEIVLERITKSTALPPTLEIESQLSGEEILWNLPGTLEEKEILHSSCGLGCHSFQQIFKNRYDERSWSVIVNRMLHRRAALIHPQDKVGPEEQAKDRALAKWLARVRGPESTDAPLHVFPRLTGSSNRVVVTEYELPRATQSIHDVYGDSNGNIWYTNHYNRYIGRLNTRTGIVTEFQIPLIEGALPGTHHVHVEKNGTVLFSEPWAHRLLKYNPTTDKFTDIPAETTAELNNTGLGNFAVTPDGFLLSSSNSLRGGDHSVQKIDPNTGKIVKEWPIKARFSYDDLISDDGNFWAGGAPVGTDQNAAELLDLRTGKMLNFDTGARPSSARRGGFDPFGNAWFAGENGTLVELDTKAKRMREYWPPTPPEPYTDFYSAMPDKNGDVWVGELHGKGLLRFNPRLGHWTEYAMPEPYAVTRDIWVDNSTTPVTVWYPDFSTGRIVRIQPRN
jgi:streptogramin lyase/mono/diheme cytochrome c family protein